ncbi:TPA: hypothetical protein RQK93_004672 [Vibrio vulnificus]|nr:hypothetical protein [Vibrio vulnificus]
MTDYNQQIQNKVEAIKSKYKNRIAEVQKDGAERVKRINEDAPDPSNFEAVINFTFDIKWKVTSIKVDIPKFSMERETLKFDIPEVRMKTESIKFDVPATRTKRVCLFKKPVFRNWKWYSECVYGNKPEVYMRRVEIKTDIPVFNSKRVDIKFDKPVVRMETTEIKLHLPHFYLKQVDVQIEAHQQELQDVASDMSNELSVVQGSMKEELKVEITKEIVTMFDDIQQSILENREQVAANYDDAIDKTKQSIKRLKESNATSEVQRLESQLAKTVEEYQNTLESIDHSLRELNSQEEEALRGLDFT